MQLHDKLTHFTIISLVSLSYIFIGLYNFIPVSILAIGKEIADDLKKNRTGFDLNDLLADFMGYGVTTFLLYLIFNY